MPKSLEKTYPLGSVARLTGLSPEVLRAWERRHRAVSPLRTPGGTRRYRASDLERLCLLKAAIEAGHRIGELAALSDAELEPLAASPTPAPRPHGDDLLAAIADYDAAEAQRLLALQLSALGVVRFAREIVVPLAREIGERWADGRLGVACEHLATALLRSFLGAALQPGATALRGPRIVFATLSGERHELGLLMAAQSAMAAGAYPLYLGPDVPAEELVLACAQSGAAALALSLVTPPDDAAATALESLRRELPAGVAIWVGGGGVRALVTGPGVERIASLEQLERRVALLLERGAADA